jgi:hypothetical protein
VFYEYALEPAVLKTWQNVRFFLDAFGPWKGRFLVEYPGKWKRMVYEGLTCADYEKHKIIERLQRLDKRVFSPRRGAPWGPALAPPDQLWRANTTKEHVRQPFRAIIVAGPPSGGAFIEAEAVTDDHPLWRVEPGAAVARDPAAFVRTLDLLIRSSSHLVMVDPYFRADQGAKLDALLHLCRALVGRTVTIDVHASEGVLAYHEFSRLVHRAVPQNLPRGITVTFRSWIERRGGERFHNRYVLTDVGGVQFGDSIERGEGGQFDRLSLLGHDERLRLWSQFYGSAPAFDLAGELKISSTS